MPKGKPLRNRNGFGTVVKLSGRRREPYEVRVNTRMDDRNYPVFDVLGRYSDRNEALIALAEYNRSPYDIQSRSLSFSEVYHLWYKYKYEDSKRKYSKSSMSTTKGAYNKCEALHERTFADIRTIDLQTILDNYNLSHAYMEHIKNLFNQMYHYALEYDIIQKDYSKFCKITKEDDDEHGEPFTQEDVNKLWTAAGSVPYVDTILIMIYSGWRVNEFLSLEEINLKDGFFRGGIKTKASKHRLVPIHSKIADMVKIRLQLGWVDVTYQTYMKEFSKALKAAGIKDKHTPHDCRHTFTTLLNNADANSVSIKRLLGHSSGSDITEKIYTHKDIEQLRIAIEKI